MANKDLKKKEIKEKNVKNKKVKSKVKDSNKNFGKGLKSELKKVSWQTPSELFKSTLAVLVIIIIIGVIVFCLDIVFESMNKYGLDKIRDSIQSSQNEVDSEDIVDDTTVDDDTYIQEDESINLDDLTETDTTTSDEETEEETVVEENVQE